MLKGKTEQVDFVCCLFYPSVQAQNCHGHFGIKPLQIGSLWHLSAKKQSSNKTNKHLFTSVPFGKGKPPLLCAFDSSSGNQIRWLLASTSILLSVRADSKGQPLPWVWKGLCAADKAASKQWAKQAPLGLSLQPLMQPHGVPHVNPATGWQWLRYIYIYMFIYVYIFYYYFCNVLFIYLFFCTSRVPFSLQDPQ